MGKLTKRAVDSMAIPDTGQIFLWNDELRGFGVRAIPSGLKPSSSSVGTSKAAAAGSSVAASASPSAARRRTRSYRANYANVTEPDERGAILVATVFDLVRIATGGCGRLSPGELHPDLVGRIATKASKTVQRQLDMCIRAFDYLPAKAPRRHHRRLHRHPRARLQEGLRCRLSWRRPCQADWFHLPSGQSLRPVAICRRRRAGWWPISRNGR